MRLRFDGFNIVPFAEELYESIDFALGSWCADSPAVTSVLAGYLSAARLANRMHPNGHASGKTSDAMIQHPVADNSKSHSWVSSTLLQNRDCSQVRAANTPGSRKRRDIQGTYVRMSAPQL
jgi:hypothetical protein